MKLQSPFAISPRLLPGLFVGGAWLQLEMLPREFDGRNRYRYTIDLPRSRKPVIGSDLRSGCQGGTLQEGFGSLLAFLDSCREGGENETLFPRNMRRWLSGLNECDLYLLREQIESSATLIS